MMGEDGERPVWKRDNFTHGHIVEAVVEKDAIFGKRPSPSPFTSPEERRQERRLQFVRDRFSQGDMDLEQYELEVGRILAEGQKGQMQEVGPPTDPTDLESYNEQLRNLDSQSWPRYYQRTPEMYTENPYPLGTHQEWQAEQERQKERAGEGLPRHGHIVEAIVYPDVHEVHEGILSPEQLEQTRAAEEAQRQEWFRQQEQEQREAEENPLAYEERQMGGPPQAPAKIDLNQNLPHVMQMPQGQGWNRTPTRSGAMDPYESWLVSPDWEKTSAFLEALPAAGELAAGAAEGAGAAGAGGAAGGMGLMGGGGMMGLPLIGGLMGKALGGMVGKGGPQSAPGEESYQSPLHPMSSLVEVFAHGYETPTSNPDVGVKHDDPEEVDQHEFNDDDKSPKNPKNPHFDESGNGSAKGEDEVRDQAGFGPNSPAMERLEMLFPLVMHHFHTGEGGSDPLLLSLHEMLEDENPGYLTHGDRDHAEKFIMGIKTPENVKSAAGEQPMGHPGWAPAWDGQGGGSAMAPGSETPPGGGQPMAGHCPHCGGVLDGTGACPQCGFSEGNDQTGQMTPMEGGSAAFTPAMGEPQQQTFAAITQGPVTPEQQSAVIQQLETEGRGELIPLVPLDPGNPIFVKILREIQNNPEVAPSIGPQEQTQPPPPAPPGGPGSASPVPGMGGGEAGGGPMQPMASFLPDFEAIFASDNIAEKCPACGSHTTGMVGDEEHTQHCHACGHLWKKDDSVDDSQMAGNSTTAALHIADAVDQHAPNPTENPPRNPVAAPAAEQEIPLNQGKDQDSSMTWQDTEGQPLQAGRTYQLVSPKYPIPDLIRVTKVKPDGIDVEMLGTYTNQSDSLAFPDSISREELQTQKLSFEPADQNADESGQQQALPAGTPGHQQIPPSGQTTDEQENSYPPYGQTTSSVQDDQCPKCGHLDRRSSMIDSTKIEHECYRCLNTWITKEAQESVEGDELRSWVMDDDEDDFSERMAAMARARADQGTRNIRDIASKDQRATEIKERLNQRKMEKESGRHFSPKEQRSLIDEDGMARNSDLLDLENTHYREDITGKSNADNVPDSHILLGLL